MFVNFFTIFDKLLAFYYYKMPKNSNLIFSLFIGIILGEADVYKVSPEKLKE